MAFTASSDQPFEAAVRSGAAVTPLAPTAKPCPQPPSATDSDPAERYRASLRIPRFSLRTAFIALSVICAWLALMSAVNTLWMVILAWASLMITAHVGGNLTGSSLFRGNRIMDEGPAFISPRVVAAPSTRLREKASFGRSMVILTAISAAIGGLVVLAYLIFGVRPRPPALGLLVGGVSAAVIGGQVGFLTGSFVNVFHTAFRQASGKLPPPEPHLRGGAGSGD